MLYIALIALVAGAFGACTTAEFEPGPQVSGPQVSFLVTNPTSIEFTGAEGEEVQRLVLSRFETEKELEVFILADMPKEDMPLFNIPESVVFEAGQATAELVMTIDHAKFESDKTYTVGFYIDETATTPYGCSEWTVKFALNPWELMTDDKGNNVKGKFRGNDLFSATGADPEVEIDVNVYEHKSRKGYYKVEKPWMLSTALGFGFPSVEEALAAGLGGFDTDFVIDATNPNQVIIEEQSVGVDVGYGEMFVMSGYPDYLDAASGSGTLVDGVITFPAKSCLLYMPAYNATSLFYGNSNGMFRLMLPGVDISDYSLAVAYDGMDVAADNKTTTAKFKFSYGDDVTGINYMIVAGNQESQAAALLATLVAGTDENILAVENFEKGGKQANVKVGLESGLYTIVAAPADKNGALRTAEAVVNSFYFVGMGEVIDMTCQFEGLMVLPSEYNPALTASYPDQTSLFLMLAGKDIKSAKYYLNTTAAIATWTDTPEALVAAYGSEFPASYVDKINSENGVVVPFQKLAEDTEYAAIVVATNIYGESKTLILTKKTAANDYNGELKIGNYYMACTYGGATYENLFTVTPDGKSEVDFIVKNIGYDLSQYGMPTNFIAKYDSAAGTLTLSGVEKGYEQYGSAFGVAYATTNQEGTQGLAFMSYATASSTDGTDPLVLTVDPTTKEVCGIKNALFAVVLAELNAKYVPTNVLEMWGYYAGASTTIAPYARTASKQSVNNESVVPFRNATGVRSFVPAKDKFAVSFKAGEALNVASKGVKSVKPSVVENYTPVKSKGFKVVEISGAKIAR